MRVPAKEPAPPAARGVLAKGVDNHGDWLERLSPERPSKTIVAHIGKDTYGYVHPYQPRALSVREAARVQSFRIGSTSRRPGSWMPIR